MGGRGSFALNRELVLERVPVTVLVARTVKSRCLGIALKCLVRLRSKFFCEAFEKDVLVFRDREN